MARETILVVNPHIEDFAAYDHFSKPLGLLLVAAQLERVFDVVCIDALERSADARTTRADGCGPFRSEVIAKPALYADVPRHYRRYGLPAAEFVARLASVPRPRAMLVTSGMTYWYRGLRHTIDLLKSVFPGVPVIVGGTYACLLPEHARVASEADHLVAEQDLAQVLGRLSRILGREIPLVTLAPAWHLLGPQPYLPLLTGSGCPYRCRFCSGWRLAPFSRLPLDSILATVRHAVQRLGVRRFAFYDDALLVGSSGHALPLFQALAREFPGISLHTPNGVHAREVTPAVAQAMRAAGFVDVRLSLESGDEEYLAKSGNKVARQEFARAVRCLLDAGFAPGQIRAYCLANAPGIPVASVYATLGFARECGAVPMLTWFTPVPGSEDFADLSRTHDLSDPLTHNNSSWIYQVGPGADEYARLKAAERGDRPGAVFSSSG